MFRCFRNPTAWLLTTNAFVDVFVRFRTYDLVGARRLNMQVVGEIPFYYKALKRWIYCSFTLLNMTITLLQLEPRWTGFTVMGKSGDKGYCK